MLRTEKEAMVVEDGKGLLMRCVWVYSSWNLIDKELKAEVRELGTKDL